MQDPSQFSAPRYKRLIYSDLCCYECVGLWGVPKLTLSQGEGNPPYVTVCTVDFQFYLTVK